MKKVKRLSLRMIEISSLGVGLVRTSGRIPLKSKCHAPLQGEDIVHTLWKRKDQLDSLFFIGHTKVRDIKEKGQEESYQQLTSNLEFDYDALFTDKADIIASCYIERNVKDNSLESTTRYIYFRPNGFVDAGSRFKDMPERVPMTARDYISAFEQGAKGTYTKPLTKKELDKKKKQEDEQRQQEAQKFTEAKKSNFEGLETVEDYHSKIQEIKEALDSETAREKGEQLKEAGLPLRFKEIEDLEQLKLFLKIVASDD